jgi:hypothetical protein
VHAYHHRKEGDLSNAGYWYKRTGRPQDRESLDEERTKIVNALANELADRRQKEVRKI